MSNDEDRNEPVQPTAEDVIAGVRSTLPDYPNTAMYVNADKITRSVTDDWPHEPPPILYLLYMASASSEATHQIGREGARSLLDRIEELVTWLRSDLGVTGSWESRVRKMTALTRHRAGDRHRERYQEFQSALFELITAGQLRHPSLTITFLADGGTVGPDLGIALAGAEAMPLVSVEAYAPHKGIADWYASYVAEPWKSAVSGPPGRPPNDTESDAQVEHPGIDPSVLPRALSNVLTDGNFQRQKVHQLAAGVAPTLLAVRADMLTAKKYQIAPAAGGELAAAIGREAWAKLPPKCLGLLLVMLAGQPIFIPAPWAAPTSSP